MVHEVLLSLPLAAAIAISLGLAAYVGLRSALRVRNLFVMMALGVAFLAGTFWLELASTTLAEKLFWNDLEYIVNVALPPIFLLFTTTFLGRKVITGPRRLLLFIFPAFMLAMVWTNELHYLFYTSVWLEGSGYFTTFGHTYGIGFYLHTAYSASLLLYSTALLIIYFLRSSPMQRRQVGLVLVATFVVLSFLIVGLSSPFPLSLTYLFVIGFTISGVLIFVGTFMYELFDVVPLAMEKILETVEDGIIVISNDGRVIYANPTVARAAMNGGKSLYASTLTAISPQLTRENIERAQRGERVEVTMGGKERIYSLKVTPILDREGTITSTLLTLGDITEEKQIQRSLEEANIKLNLLSSITRHDILNQVTVVKGAGELLRSSPLETAQVQKYGDMIMEAAETIERQFTFTRDYQSLGDRAPEWRSAEAAFRNAHRLGLAAGLEAEVELAGIELLVDPLFERVFSVLLDNTRRHGERATKAWVSASEKDGSLVLTYRDNGVGIPDDEKERIFERGHGRSGGLGLFLAKQILDVSGAQIKETGRFGEGARFEIIFPPGRWRRAAVVR